MPIFPLSLSILIGGSLTVGMEDELDNIRNEEVSLLFINKDVKISHILASCQKTIVEIMFVLVLGRVKGPGLDFINSAQVLTV